MNKLTKVGCSALCGSLAAISAANAGDLTVTGGADMTWVSLSKQVTGNPIGIGSNFSLKGSGELDNGWTVDLTIAHTNAGAYSSTVVDLGLGSLGKLNFNSGDSGNGIQAYDDKMPTAWEEPWGAGLSTGVSLVSGVGPSSNVQYTTPTILGTTVAVAYAHTIGNTDNADKTGGGATKTDSMEEGLDVTINVNPSFGTEILSGLNLFVGGSHIEQPDHGTPEEDKLQATGGYTFDLGPVSIGQQVSGVYTGETDGTNEFNGYKAVHFGIAFNVSDDLSISYGTTESRQETYTQSNVTHSARTIDVDSIQAAYTMGGASFRIASVDVTNAFYQTSTSNDSNALIVSMGLAF